MICHRDSAFLAVATLIVTACAGEPAPVSKADSPSDSLSGLQWVAIGRTLREAVGIAGPIPRGDGRMAAKREYQLNEAQKIGLSHYRNEFNQWVEAESQPGVFVFPEDDLVEQARAKGQGILGIVGFGNPLYSIEGRKHNDHMYPPDDPASIEGYAFTLASYYRGRIDRWEFWNEPNGGYRFWKSRPGGDAPAFADLALVAARAMRAGNPDAKLALGGFFYHDYIVVPGAVRFLDAVMRARPQLRDLYDAVSFHPYKPYPPVDPPEMAGSWDEDQDATIDAMRAIMARHGMADKEIWITENGWPTGPLVDETDQARYLVRGALTALAKGVKEYDWYTFWDSEDPSQLLAPPEGYFGLVRPGTPGMTPTYLPDGPNPPQKKLGFTALAVLLAELGAMIEIAEISGDWKPWGVRLMALRAEGRCVLVAWRSGFGGEFAIELPPNIEGKRPRAAVDMLGRSVSLPAPGERFYITPSPVYVRYE